jgi:hypothetical protein
MMEIEGCVGLGGLSSFVSDVEWMRDEKQVNDVSFLEAAGMSWRKERKRWQRKSKTNRWSHLQHQGCMGE